MNTRTTQFVSPPGAPDRDISFDTRSLLNHKCKCHYITTPGPSGVPSTITPGHFTNVHQKDANTFTPGPSFCNTSGHSTCAQKKGVHMRLVEVSIRIAPGHLFLVMHPDFFPYAQKKCLHNLHPDLFQMYQNVEVWGGITPGHTRQCTKKMYTLLYTRTFPCRTKKGRTCHRRYAQECLLLHPDLQNKCKKNDRTATVSSRGYGRIRVPLCHTIR